MGAYATPVGLDVQVPAAGSTVIPNPAPATGRGQIIQLGKAVGVNLNSAASTTIVTTPGAGFTRAVILWVVRDNDSIAATTASVQFGSAASADWAATAVDANAATTKYQLLTSAATLSPVYGTGVAFQVTVTIVQGAAATADFAAWGYYE